MEEGEEAAAQEGSQGRGLLVTFTCHRKLEPLSSFSASCSPGHFLARHRGDVSSRCSHLVLSFRPPLPLPFLIDSHSSVPTNGLCLIFPSSLLPPPSSLAVASFTCMFSGFGHPYLSFSPEGHNALSKYILYRLNCVALANMLKF